MVPQRYHSGRVYSGLISEGGLALAASVFCLGNAGFMDEEGRVYGVYLFGDVGGE